MEVGREGKVLPPSPTIPHPHFLPPSFPVIPRFVPSFLLFFLCLVPFLFVLHFLPPPFPFRYGTFARRIHTCTSLTCAFLQDWGGWGGRKFGREGGRGDCGEVEREGFGYIFTRSGKVEEGGGWGEECCVWRGGGGGGGRYEEYPRFVDSGSFVFHPSPPRPTPTLCRATRMGVGVGVGVFFLKKIVCLSDASSLLHSIIRCF